MAKQTINQGTAPTGAGGDTFRTGSAKLQANDDEIYKSLGGTGTGNSTLPAALPIANGGTGAITAALARTNLGLGDAAIKNSGTGSGQVPLYGVNGLSNFGYGGLSPVIDSHANIPNMVGFYSVNDSNILSEGGAKVSQYAHTLRLLRSAAAFCDLLIPYGAGINANAMSVRTSLNGSSVMQAVYTSKNPIIFTTAKVESSGRIVTVESTGELRSRGFTVDGNGFYKSASPIIQLLADRIELNEEAKQQDISFKKLEIGDYLIKGSSGFAQEGWHVETPKDANGNVLFSVLYYTLENGDISVKTYKKKFDLETASIVADLNNPVDITEGRWIDLRLQELPQPEIEEDLESVGTPFNFQPTGLAQAVSAVMESYHDLE